MRFGDIVGHDTTKKSLIQSVLNNQIAHAQLFSGPEGSPILALALGFATFINCTDRKGEDSCGNCPSCHKIDRLIHPDIHFVFPVSTSKISEAKKVKTSEVTSQVYLGEWRKFLEDNSCPNIEEWSNYYGAENKQSFIGRAESRQIIRELSLKAFEAQYKIMIIWLPELMHPTAANALLKILEEPPDKTLFFLVSSDREKVLSTILSRVRTIGVRPFLDQEIQEILEKDFQISKKRATQIARLSAGNLQEAIRMTREKEEDSHKLFRDWMRACYKADYRILVDGADQFSRLTKVGQKNLMNYGLNILRNCLVIREDPALVRLQEEEMEFVQNFQTVMTPQKIDHISKSLDEAYYHIERNANPKILFMDISLFISKIFKSNSRG